MNTQNIISTPDITGNIGSCTSQSIEAVSGRTLFKENIITVVTNSCTGDVKEYQSWRISGATVVITFIGIIVAFALFALLISIADEINKSRRY